MKQEIFHLEAFTKNIDTIFSSPSDLLTRVGYSRLGQSAKLVMQYPAIEPKNTCKHQH